MTTADRPPPPTVPTVLWEDEIPSTDESFLRIGPEIPLPHSREEDE
ncbi:hypothetical protein ACWGJ2_31745 [Streptomyces sp. NPDC054796]